MAARRVRARCHGWVPWAAERSEATTLPHVVTNLSLHRGKPGGGKWCRARVVVVNLSLHRGKPGGGGWWWAWGGSGESAAPPGQARWGRMAHEVRPPSHRKPTRPSCQARRADVCATGNFVYTLNREHGLHISSDRTIRQKALERSGRAFWRRRHAQPVVRAPPANGQPPTGFFPREERPTLGAGRGGGTRAWASTPRRGAYHHGARRECPRSMPVFA